MATRKGPGTAQRISEWWVVLPRPPVVHIKWEGGAGSPDVTGPLEVVIKRGYIARIATDGERMPIA